MFSKILVANRGEIAVRVIRACKEMGVAAVAVYSEADRDALHVNLADERYCIGPAPAKDSYLNINNILTAARLSRAEAIHPGYGFLSESPAFSAACQKNGFVFIGPDADVIARMGDKDAARRTVAEAGVPVVPGCDLVRDAAHARREAGRIGYPCLVKARAGGGGRGIRLANTAGELEAAYKDAVREAELTFKDSAVYIEKFLTDVKHIEMQILADVHGNVVCLGERDCSVQRRNQKLVEEAPAPTLLPQTRAAMIEASVKAARAARYQGAGTVEYLCDKDGHFYFCEMNTRLQVEHPVTEMVTGIDLVQWQLRVAAGVPLSFTQEDIHIGTCAIECRINAENPEKNFRPSCGTIQMLHVPGGPLVRFDTAIYHGYTVPPYYDSMIGKLIVAARSRNEALRKMRAALCELIIEGVEHNADLQTEILTNGEFESGRYTTGTLAGILADKDKKTAE